MSAPGLAVPRLLDELLAEQRTLTAVDRFSRVHADLEGRAYEERIPGTRPGEGQQYAFRVDLDACTGCKACVTACHSLNGLDAGETWREVGLLVGSGPDGPVQQTVTGACHHCEDPGCLSGCPVRAYEKDPDTGIVVHLDDQCIGCRYCTLTCPYDVPSYDATRGIVRKCDMCTGRLAAGEPPACVQGCPNGAITIAVVDRPGPGDVPDLLPGLADLPDGRITRPSTLYETRREGLALRPGADDEPRPAPAHDPLAAMLVLVQASVGLVLFDLLVTPFDAEGSWARPARLGLALAAAGLGLAASTAHLGRPLYAFRAFLGVRTSWMSREILVLGPYAGSLAAALAVALWVPEYASAASAAALALGVVGGICSVMIYVVTRRPYWSPARSAGRFAGSALVLGTAGAALAALVAGGAGAVPLLALGAAAAALKVTLEVLDARRVARLPVPALARSGRLLAGPLRPRLVLRVGLAAAGVVLALAAAAAAPVLPAAAAAVAAVACAALLCAELVERHLYFTAEAGPGMPGR